MLPTARGRLRAQNTRIGIGETGTEPALTAAITMADLARERCTSSYVLFRADCRCVVSGCL
jgi:hypothetical protein